MMDRHSDLEGFNGRVTASEPFAADFQRSTYRFGLIEQ